MSGPKLLGITSPHISVTHVHLTAREKVLNRHFTEGGLVCQCQITGYPAGIGIILGSMTPSLHSKSF